VSTKLDPEIAKDKRSKLDGHPLLRRLAEERDGERRSKLEWPKRRQARR
jgi:hypothetical protein